MPHDQPPPLPPQPPVPEPSGTQPEVQIEVCEKHGLRYNAATDDGCARCRTEAGGRTVERSDFATQRTPDVSQGLLIAAVLVAFVGGGLFLAHTVAYKAGTALMDQVMDESFDFEEGEEDLYDDMTEEEAAEAFEDLFGEDDGK